MPSEAAPKKERAAAFSEADCPVCYSNIVRITDTLTPEEKKDGLAVEEKVQKYCDKVCAPPRASRPPRQPYIQCCTMRAGVAIHFAAYERTDEAHGGERGQTRAIHQTHVHAWNVAPLGHG